jgi:predicted dehydrogenase
MIRMAILGPGRISRRFLAGMKQIQDAEVTAFASRHPDTVRDYADRAGITRILSYEELYQAPDIDAVYISTPPHVHAEQIEACLRGGKHVLVEKPIAVHAADAQRLYALAAEQGLTLMEAQKALFVPPFLQVQKWLQEGRIGTPRAAEASFCRLAEHAKDHWVMTAPGKGCVYDVGCYPLAALLRLFPDAQLSSRTDVLEDGCPVSSHIVLQEADMILSADSSFRYDRGGNLLIIYGDRGRIECPTFWHGHDARLITPDHEEPFHADFDSEFTFETRHFLDLIQAGESFSPVMAPELSTRIIGICEQTQ